VGHERWAGAGDRLHGVSVSARLLAAVAPAFIATNVLAGLGLEARLG
jgi:hypothetical protein